MAQFGNNSSLIRQLMRSRPGWAPGPGDPGNAASKANYEEKCVKMAPSDDLPEIHFLWTQYPQKAFLGAMAARRPGLRVVLNEEARLQLKQVKASSSSNPAVQAHNHFEGGSAITSKAGLRETVVAFYLRHNRDPFGAIPLTFVIREGTGDPEYTEWRRAYDNIEEQKGQRMWLVKPGDKANRGNGIRIYDNAEELAARLDSKPRCWVAQKYMEAPLLIHRRKFDIRAYCLVKQEPGGGAMRAFFYREAYLRTTSAEYSTKTKDRMVHLNNDAVQKKGDDYGKFESANKMSFLDFQRYLDENHSQDRFSVQNDLVPQICSLMADTVRAAEGKLNPQGIDNCFEVFGFDFMVDAGFRAWLIEVNSNPCLELCCSYLSHLIPKMLEEALQVTLDQLFPQAAAQGGANGVASTGWEQVYCSSDQDADAVSCEWVEQLPADTLEPDFAMLGSALLSPQRPGPGGAGRKRSRGPKKAKAGTAAK